MRERSAERVLEFAAETLALREMTDPVEAIKDAAKWVGISKAQQATLLAEAFLLHQKEAA